jgi:hypothetical protein
MYGCANMVDRLAIFEEQLIQIPDEVARDVSEVKKGAKQAAPQLRAKELAMSGPMLPIEVALCANP